MRENNLSQKLGRSRAEGMGGDGSAGEELLGSPSIGVSLDCHGVSVAGKGRRVNQDDYVLAPLEAPELGPAFLFAVADGIGGGPAGERASSMAIQSFHEFVRKSVSEPEVLRRVGAEDLLRKGVLRSHEEILSDIEAHPELFGMGTTLTAALVLWPRVWVVNAGDSRAYRLRDGHLDRLTSDHTLIQKLTEEGILNADTARRSRWRNAIWNHLGKNSSPVNPEIVETELRPDDAILLSTDGITDLLSDAELETLAAGMRTAGSVSGKFLWAAGEKGGRDDMTVIFARFVGRAEGAGKAGDRQIA